MPTNSIRPRFDVIYAVSESNVVGGGFGEGCAYQGAIACIVRSHA